MGKERKKKAKKNISTAKKKGIYSKIVKNLKMYILKAYTSSTCLVN